MTAQVGYDLTEVRTSAQGPAATLGTRFEDNIGNAYRYIQASSALAVNEYVKISNDNLWTAAPATTTNIASGIIAQVGCPQVAIASGGFGWVQIKGLHSGKFLALNVLGVKAYVTATAGCLDDTATTLVTGVTALTTNGGATAVVQAFASVDMYASGQ